MIFLSAYKTQDKTNQNTRKKRFVNLSFHIKGKYHSQKIDFLQSQSEEHLGVMNDTISTFKNIINERDKEISEKQSKAEIRDTLNEIYITALLMKSDIDKLVTLLWSIIRDKQVTKTLEFIPHILIDFHNKSHQFNPRNRNILFLTLIFIEFMKYYNNTFICLARYFIIHCHKSTTIKK